MARAAAAARAPARAHPRPKPKARPRPRATPRPRKAQRSRVAGGAAWIGLVAFLLAGVVALNVAVLRLNVRFEELGQERSKLRADNAELESQLASRAAAARIQGIARGRGLVPAAPDQWTYLDLRAAPR